MATGRDDRDCERSALAATKWDRVGHHLGRLVGASHEAFNKSHIKTPHTPSSPYIFLPLIHLLRHTCMNMEAVKGFLAPLGLNTNSIQDTLVCLLCSFPVSDKGFELCFAETRCYWRYSRDRAKGLDICLEWIRRLFVPHFEDDVVG